MGRLPSMSTENNTSRSDEGSPILLLAQSEVRVSLEMSSTPTCSNARSEAPTLESLTEPASDGETTSDDESEEPRHYPILIKRLRKVLELSAPSYLVQDKLELHCPCGRGDLGGGTVRCDVPTCSVRWYHSGCIPYGNEQLSNEFDVFICPACYTHQLVDLLKEKHPNKKSVNRGTSRAPSDLDDVVKQQVNMNRIDAEHAKDGRWIFNDPIDRIARNQRINGGNDTVETKQFHSATRAAPTAAPTFKKHSVNKDPDYTSFEAPIPGTLGASAAMKAKLSMSVNNFSSLQASARIWTCDETQVVITSEETVTIQYKHDYFPSGLEDDLSTCPRFILHCPNSKQLPRNIEVPLVLLTLFSQNIRLLNKELCLYRGGSGIVGRIELSHVDTHVLSNALKFLEGGYLSISIPCLNTPITSEQKLALIQYTHLAHILGIQPLQNAAMHALCSSLLRQPQDWADTWHTADLLNDMTLEGNPARRVLFEGTRCLVPDKSTNQLPCGVEQRDIICLNKGVKAMWRETNVMGILPVENGEGQDVGVDEMDQGL